ncbi:MAG: hypothetical protein P0Y53_02500 [Candidatus Pseudobacter hemicellulosilyticus]|uniref:Glycosyltransferase RgtA/B/C/D-like domain-containing protein n=1 Tax=Candidatus Pseudobacter hemicellulosilyticus TaxID=3121375 RepID=A0AAJ5WUG8_9BACT|nr:MAG: hypothetical protein P0Y53_02500 [Pseudobacter sp.]
MTPQSLLNSKWSFPLLCAATLLLSFHQLFTAEYAFTDEAFQLWHNHDRTNFNGFFVQGRPITALLLEKLYGSIDRIDSLKWLRLFSLGGWLITAPVYVAVLAHFIRIAQLPRILLLPLSVLIGGSASVAIYIGWAACAEVFIACLTGLLSGYCMFYIYHPDTPVKFRGYWALGAIVAGLISLLTYQSAFGAFLLPFFILFIGRQSSQYRTATWRAIVMYGLIHIAYFVIFKKLISAYGIEASDRTLLTREPLRKIGFFFSTPLAQALSFNFLYNVKGLFSQLFYYGMLTIWAVSVFAGKPRPSLKAGLGHILGVLVLMGLIFLPVLVSRENFASYRTMFALNIAGSVLLLNMLFSFVRHAGRQQWLALVTAFLFLVTAWYNTNNNFISPLANEYQRLSTFLRDNYPKSNGRILVVRPPEAAFTALYGVKVYRDEFGMPSTYKGWTPDPLIRQLVDELTGRYDAAVGLFLINVKDQEALKDLPPGTFDDLLLLDIGALLQ